MKYLIKKLVGKYVLQYLYKYLLLFLLSVVSINTVIAQDYISPEYTAKYFTVNVSNTHPKINEPVTIKMKYKAPRNLPGAIIYFNFNHKGIQLISGEFFWRGELKENQIIKREITIKFTKKRVYGYSIGVRQSVTDEGIAKAITFYVGGAIDEDYRVRDIRGRIKMLKNALADTSLKGEAKREAAGLGPLRVFFSRGIFPGAKQSNPPVQRLTVEEIAKKKKNKRKNDSLLAILQQEYDSLKTLLPPQQHSGRGFLIDSTIKNDSVIKDKSINRR